MTDDTSGPEEHQQAAASGGHPTSLELFPVGAAFERRIRVSETHLVLASAVFGTNGPAHTDESYDIGGVTGRVIPGSLLSGWLSALIADTFLPAAGPYLGESIRFRAPVRAGDDITLSITVTANEEREGKGSSMITVGTAVRSSSGQLIADGEARLLLNHIWARTG
jgi:3-hydroxybutyryl-CoA dehydratase